MLLYPIPLFSLWDYNMNCCESSPVIRLEQLESVSPLGQIKVILLEIMMLSLGQIPEAQIKCDISWW